MKIRILLTSVFAALVTSHLYAAPAPQPVPDSGATVGLVALGLLAVLAVRRKLAK